MELLIIKAVCVVALVLALTAIAEKLSPKISGILSGLPVGSAITLLFFAIEMGVDYVQRVALYNIHGLFAALAFCFGYYISTFYKKRFQILFTIFLSLLFYLVISYLISFIEPHIIFTPLVVITLILGSSFYFSKKENFPTQKVQKVTLFDLLIRSSMTIVIFLCITSLPKFAPENIAGIFSSFPTILFPLLLIIHLNHSNLQARTIVKNTPFGLSSVAIYSLCIFFAYPAYGILYGTILALFASVSYIVIQIKVVNLIKSKFYNSNYT